MFNWKHCDGKMNYWGLVERLKTITNQKKLAKIVQITDSKNVSHYAASMVTDQALLTKLVTNKKTANRDLFAKRLKDQALLYQLATEDEDEKVRRNATGQITDQNMLFRLIMDNNTKYIVWDNLKDQKLWTELALHGPKLFTREIALDKLDNDAVSIKIFHDKKEDIEIRRAAVVHIKDQNVLIEALDEKEDIEIRKAAVELIEDQNALINALPQIIEWKKDGFYCGAVVDHLNDSMALIELAAVINYDSSLRKKCLEKLNEPGRCSEQRLDPQKLGAILEDESINKDLQEFILEKLIRMKKESYAPEKMIEDYRAKKVLEKKKEGLIRICEQKQFNQLLQDKETSFSILADMFDSLKGKWFYSRSEQYRCQDIAQGLRYLYDAGMKDQIKNRFPEGEYQVSYEYSEDPMYGDPVVMEGKVTITIF